MRALAFLLASLAVLASEALAKPGYPDWVASCMDQAPAIDAVENDFDALVLLDEAEIEYKGRGVVEETVRRALHVFNRDGREYASVGIPLSKGHNLKRFNGWIIYASGKVERLKKSDLVEVAVDRDMLRSDSVMLQLVRSESMRKGTVFAYEYELSRTQVFLQSDWTFHWEVPLARSRVSIEIPKDWSLHWHLFGADFVESSHSGTQYVWEARDLDGVKKEDFQPFRSLITGQLVYSIFPDESDLSRYPYVVFEDWNSVARHMDAVHTERIAGEAPLREQAQLLAEGSASKWETVSNICAYAQSLNYLAVAIDLNKGGGYVPEDANRTFETHQGDCKDMTALARAMLKAVGIDSFAVVAQIGADSWVHEEWASPHAFNHCILAVPVGADAPSRSGVVEHPEHGRLLIFDPTTKSAAPGVLPHYLEGRKVLVCSGADDRLLELPVYGPEVNRVVRRVDAKIGPDGSLSGRLDEQNFGANAQVLRNLYRSLKRDDFENLIRAWIARGTREATIEALSCEDRFAENRFDLKVNFSAPRYARALNQGEMALFSPVFLSRIQWVPPVDEERTTPYVIEARHLEETLHIELPGGYVLDSFQEPEPLETAFGSYALELDDQGGRVAVQRRNTLRHTTLPVADYHEVVDYYETVSRSESSKAILRLEEPL